MLQEKSLKEAPRLNKKISHELPNVSLIKTLLICTCILVHYAPINVNPVRGECGQGVGI